MRALPVLRRIITAWPLIVVLTSMFTQAAQAQSVIPSNLTNFFCTNYNAIVALSTVVLLVIIGCLLIYGLIRKGATLIVDIIIDCILALALSNLKSILSSFGLSPQGC